LGKENWRHRRFNGAQKYVAAITGKKENCV
jgi:hypothetical protein